jgi:diguanylate cyclase
MVLTDPLTACLNRRGFDKSLARELARASRAESEVSLVSVDIDYFKQLNDSYGHLTGDIVLREFGALLLQTARGADVVARTGGEEFSMLLPDTGAEGALRAALRICDLVRTHPFLVNGTRLQLTISAGVATVSGSEADMEEARLKQRADDALYVAKRAGRDRARVWKAELTTSM